jgi:gliding motility-associated-like protein
VGSTPNCTDTTTQNIFLNTIEANFNFVNKCVYDSIEFVDMSNLNGDTATSYTWTFADGNFSDETNPVHKYNISGFYNVTLQVQSSGGCVDTTTKVVEVYPKPSAGFDYYSEEYIEGNIVEFNDLSAGSDSWQWAFGDGITSTVQNPTHIYNEAGDYEIIQSVSNEYNCVDTATTILTIEPGTKVLPPKLPTAFSPNGDGMNDVFYPRGGPFKTIDFKIYNSWGQEVYATQKLNEGWDGTYKGVDQQVGVYVWTISAITIDGKEYIKTGDVTLIR